VDRVEPERVVRDTGARVPAAGRAMLAGTQPQATAALAQPAAADPPAAAQVRPSTPTPARWPTGGSSSRSTTTPAAARPRRTPTSCWPPPAPGPPSPPCPKGRTPPGLGQHHGPAALRATLDTATTPLADLVVDERLARWTDRLHWVEGQLGAARDAAGLIATLPPDQIGRQVLRVADRLGLDPAGLTRAVVDAVSRDGDALGRLQRRNRRADLDRGVTMTAPAAAAQFARTGYPAPPRSVAPGPGPPPVPTPARPARP